MIPNFAVVDRFLVRGGQPEGDNDWQYLAVSAGVRQVLSLNGSGDEIAIAREGLKVEGVYITDELAQQEGGSAELSTLVERASATLDAMIARAEGSPIFIHCTEGVDRTGVVVARYRVRRCGWTREQAYAEWVVKGSHRYKGLEAAWETSGL